MTLTKAARMIFNQASLLVILLQIYIISYVRSCFHACDFPLLYRESLQFPIRYVNDPHIIYIPSFSAYVPFHILTTSSQYIMKSLLLLVLFLSFFFGSLFATRHLPYPSMYALLSRSPSFVFYCLQSSLTRLHAQVIIMRELRPGR